MYHLPRMCRTCLQMSRGDFKFVSLDSVDPLWESNSPNLKEQLISLVPEMKIESSGAYICTSCFIALRTAYEFKRMCQQTELKFQNHNYKYRRPFGVGPGSAQFHVTLNETGNNYQAVDNLRCQNLNYLQADTSIDITEHHLYDANKVLPRKQLTLLNNVTQKLPEIDVEVIMPPEKPVEQPVEETPPPKKLDSFALRKKYNIGSEISILKTENKTNSNTQLIIKTACEVIPFLKENGINPDLLNCCIRIQNLTQEFVRINTCDKYSLDELMDITKVYYFDQLDDTLTCQFCTKSFATRFSLQMHEEDHAVDKFFNCPHCQMQFLRQNNLEQHLKTHNPVAISPDSNTAKPPDPKVEEEEEEEEAKPDVKEEYPTDIDQVPNLDNEEEENLKKEVKIEDNKDGLIATIKSIAILEKAETEMKTEETKDKILSDNKKIDPATLVQLCDDVLMKNANKIKEDPDLLKPYEMVTSTPIKKIKGISILKGNAKRYRFGLVKYCKCLICNKICRNKLSLNQHCKFSHIPKVSSKYWSNILLKSRSKRKPVVAPTLLVETDIKEVITGTRHACNICDKRFSEENFLNLHMYVHTVMILATDNPNAVGDDGPEIYICYLCNKAFTKERYLKLHNLQVHLCKTTTCKICSRVFKSEFWFTRHRCQLPVEIPEVQDDANKTYPCTFCNRSFARLRFMKSHRKRMHNDIMTRGSKIKPQYLTSRNGKGSVEIGNLDLDDPMKLFTIAGSSTFEDDEDVIEILSDSDRFSDETSRESMEPAEENEVSDSVFVPHKIENQKSVETERNFDLVCPKPNNEAGEATFAFKNSNEISSRRKSVSRTIPKIQCDFCGEFIEENVYDNHIYEHNKIRLQKSARKSDANYDSTFDESLDKNKIILKCHICFRGFQRKYHLLNHVNRHLNGELNPTITVGNPSEDVDECEEGPLVKMEESGNKVQSENEIIVKSEVVQAAIVVKEPENPIPSQGDSIHSEIDGVRTEDDETNSDNEASQKEADIDESAFISNLEAANNSDVYQCCGRSFKLKAHFFRHYKIKHPSIRTELSRRERRRARAKLRNLQTEEESDDTISNSKARYCTRNSLPAQPNIELEEEEDEEEEMNEREEENDNDEENEIAKEEAEEPEQEENEEVNEEMETATSYFNSATKRKLTSVDEETEELTVKRRRRTKTESDVILTRAKLAATPLPLPLDDLEIFPVDPKLSPKYECHVCEKKFKQKCQLRDHFNVHTGDKPYKCDFCHPVRGFTQTSSLYVHYRRVHAVIMKNCLWEVYSKNGACLVCSEVFEKHAFMFGHVREYYVEKAYQCHVCIEKPNMLCHYKVHNIDPLEMRTILLANREAEAIEEHDQEEEMEEEKMEEVKGDDGSCTPTSSLTEEACDSEAESLADKTVVDLEALKCPACDKTFRTKQQLRFHKKSLAHFQQLQLLKKQVATKGVDDTAVSDNQTDTIEDIQNSVKAIMEKISNIKRHRCGTCGTCFVKKMHLRKHKRKMHRVIHPKIKTGSSISKPDSETASIISGADVEGSLDEKSELELSLDTQENVPDVSKELLAMKPNEPVVDKTNVENISLDDQDLPETKCDGEVNLEPLVSSAQESLDDLIAPPELSDDLNAASASTDEVNIPSEPTDDLKSPSETTDEVNVPSEPSDYLSAPSETTDELSAPSEPSDDLNALSETTDDSQDNAPENAQDDVEMKSDVESNKPLSDMEEQKMDSSEVVDMPKTTSNAEDSVELTSNIGDSLGSVSNIGDFLESASNAGDSAESTSNTEDFTELTSNIGEPLELASQIESVSNVKNTGESSCDNSSDSTAKAEKEILDFVDNSTSDRSEERNSASIDIGLETTKSPNFASANHSFEQPNKDSPSLETSAADAVEPNFDSRESNFDKESVSGECQKSISLAECRFEYQKNYSDVDRESLNVVTSGVSLESLKTISCPDEQCVDVDK